MEISQGIHSVGGNNGAVIFLNKLSDPTHSSFKYSKESGLIGGKWLPWGENNLYPQEFAAKLDKTGVAIGGLKVLTAAHFGTGFQLYQGTETEAAITFKERLASSFPEINDFFIRSKFNISISEIILDFETWGMGFPEYLLSPNGDSIISIRRIQAANVRFEEPKNGVINNIGVNTDWEKYKEENTTVVPCFNSNIPIEEIKLFCKQKGIRKFTIPVIETLLVEKTYVSVGWHSSFKNGWVDVVLSLPEYKKAMFTQQLNVKYLIHIADDYFSHLYGHDVWIGFTADEQHSKRTELIDLIDNELRGNKGAGKSIISPYFRDRDTGKEIKGIMIEEIGQPQSNGDFLLDGSAANYEILTPMGVDPCLINGGAFGGKSLSGSGSDKREAWTILCAKFPIRQIRTLQIFENVKYWNNWDPTIFGKFPNTNLTTLDKNPNGQTKIVN